MPVQQAARFTYSDYTEKLLNQDIIKEHLRGFVHYFKGCRHVVDVGSGEGIFLTLLREEGISGTAMENDPRLVAHLHTMGFEVVSGDAQSMWSRIERAFDGVFCSHLVEHLTFEQVLDLVEGFADGIEPGGIVVFAFPNPESVEMQLFHFWRDPQHIRFWQPDLISGVLRHYGFEIIADFSQGTWGDGAPSAKEGAKGQDAKHGLRVEATPRRKGRAKIGRGFPALRLGAQRSVLSSHVSIVRKLGRLAKRWLGITALEVEADYMRKLRAKGREAVIVARRLDAG